MRDIHVHRTLLTALLIGASASAAASPAQSPFMADSEVAMTTMMSAMHITPSGDVDADFVALMVPHHQGAIDMAKAELRYGRNEPLRRIAQGIIVTQLQEIEAMRVALGQPPAAPPMLHAPGAGK